MTEHLNIVFLDFDGCLNSWAYLESSPEEYEGVVGIDPQAVSRVNRLLTEAKAEVVVSSSWRRIRTTAVLQALLDAHGFTGKVRGRTPCMVTKTEHGLYASKQRGDEIQAWLDAADDYGIVVDSFVIIDDSNDMAHLSDRLVQTSMSSGLLDEHADRAVQMLKTPGDKLIAPTVEQISAYGDKERL